MSLVSFLEIFLEILGIGGGIILLGAGIAFTYFKLFQERKIKKNIPIEIKKEVENERGEKEGRVTEARRKYKSAANIGTVQSNESGKPNPEKPELPVELVRREDIPIPIAPASGESDNSNKPVSKSRRAGNQSIFAKFRRN